MKIFDGHNDTLTRLFPDMDAFLSGSDSGHIDLPRARQGDMGGGFFAIFIGPPPESPERDPMYGLTFTENGYITSERSPVDPDYVREYTDYVLEYAYALEAESEGSVKIARTVADIEACFEHDALAMVLTLEGAEAIEPDLSNLEDYYRKGIRSIGPVWSRPNVFAQGVPFVFPQSPDTGDGLTDAGRALVMACNDLGIMIDMAHLNEKGFFEVAELSKAPLVVTHTDVWAISPSSRNLTDAQIDAIGASGGVIGINFETLNTHPQSAIDSDGPLTQITQHIDYIVRRIGVDHVAFGSDFDGATMLDDLSDASKLPNLIQVLHDTGYDAADIEKIAYRNWLRVMRETFKE